MKPTTITTADVATLDWLTLKECATELGVAVSQVRLWCIRWREDQPGGLQYAHFGAKPEADSKRTNYRVRSDWWETFKGERSRENRREDRRITRLVSSPIDYGGTRGAGVGGRGR